MEGFVRPGCTFEGVPEAGGLAVVPPPRGHQVVLRLRPEDEVVLCITGHGLKTIEAVSGVLPEGPTIAPKLREVAALVEASGAR